MNYSKELKAAKIFNLSSFNNLTDNIFISNQADVNYYSMKRADNNRYRKVKDIQTSNININPTVRIVHLLGENKKYSSYLSFAVEPKDRSTGIAIVSLCNESNAFLCDIRILPLNTLSDIADQEEYSQLLTVNLDRSKFVLKTDITVALTENSEPLYSVDEVDVTVIADLVTQSEVIELKRELEFQGSKLAAHYLQEVLAI
ncbi:hypothetical protein AMR72_00015 [Flavobacterium psychrophilum]|nr:hypothetical protein AMR72_00015 [Flavobacterium psychrophilum]AOE51042.1 hypothetical protein ALW18_00015 [Flavobacterium psychrophilum]